MYDNLLGTKISLNLFCLSTEHFNQSEFGIPLCGDDDDCVEDVVEHNNV